MTSNNCRQDTLLHIFYAIQSDVILNPNPQAGIPKLGFAGKSPQKLLQWALQNQVH